MKHHFGDFLYRDLGHWKMTPNRERHAYSVSGIDLPSKQITVATIGKDDANWRVIFDLPNLEELTLHNPSAEQLAALGEFAFLKRLRLTHCRPKELSQLAYLVDVAELVLEYVSGFSDLGPIAQMPSLKALHLENLRRVHDFDALSAAEQLQHLSIRGTLDWAQPVEDFEFLRGLENLEVLRLWQVRCTAPSPALLAATSLKNLKHLGITGNIFQTIDYALLEVAHPDTDGAKQRAVQRTANSYMLLPDNDIRARLPEDVIKAKHPEVIFTYRGREVPDPDQAFYVLLGKGQRSISCRSKNAERRRQEHEAHYQEMLQLARQELDG